MVFLKFKSNKNISTMEPHKGLKCYDTKFFAGIDFYDYWNLEKRPAYISANKTKAP